MLIGIMLVSSSIVLKPPISGMNQKMHFVTIVFKLLCNKYFHILCMIGEKYFHILDYDDVSIDVANGQNRPEREWHGKCIIGLLQLDWTGLD